MILIASGAYIDGEFATEVGLLPPSFLFIGHQRLYHKQIDFLKRQYDEEIFLSLPKSFEINKFDLENLKELNVTIIRVPDGLTLGDSILYCWNASGKTFKSLKILHGDTLFINAQFQSRDLISVHPNKGFYLRAAFRGDEIQNVWAQESEEVISGFFSFSSPLYFMKLLIELQGNFIKAMEVYFKRYSVTVSSTGQWLDFGHINSFFHSRSLMTTERAFNALKMTPRLVTKSSPSNAKKIYAEGNWFEQLPDQLRIHTPQLLDFSKTGEIIYSLEYLYLLPLSDLLVFARLSEGFWLGVLRAIRKVLVDFSKEKPVDTIDLDCVDSMYLEKTLMRLNQYQHQSGYDINKQIVVEENNALSLIDIAHKSAQFIQPATLDDICIVHGDFCFSNLLFDSRVQAVKCVDPRGVDPVGNFTIYGDRRYDLAKLYHSVVGMYDLIIANQCKLTTNKDDCVSSISFYLEDDLQVSLEKIFKSTLLGRYSEKEIIAISVHLFLSMLPLHYDRPDRQKAFIANALRLYQKLEKLG
ncbi:aminoglycoside phosphotransferase family protein [Thiotrichales bacterium 19S3-7]|nr:aminoglycoside phosphotransferase family protein [Thiotrichales bacterium 19S3-7]MCF6800686.1 aminoglycoside phosphotransferase family protein [Thiotrichales bacterium 19S3-11]